MRITAPMPIYMSVLSVGSLLCVYPLALCLVPCQANTDEYLTERERPVRNNGTESGGKQLSSDIMTLDDLRELLRQKNPCSALVRTCCLQAGCHKDHYEALRSRP